MQLTADEDVRAVLEFMHTKIPASKLVPVAEGVSELARIIWGHHKADDIELVRLVAAPIR